MRHADFLRSVLSLMAISMLVVALGLTGCPDDDDDDEDFMEVVPNDLENQTFVFADGAEGDVAEGLGLPEGQPFTLEIGFFGGGDTAPLTLTAAGNTATGTITVTSCDFAFGATNFPEGEGPQVGDEYTADPCEISSDGNLRLVDPDSGDEATSEPATGATGSTGG